MLHKMSAIRCLVSTARILHPCFNVAANSVRQKCFQYQWTNSRSLTRFEKRCSSTSTASTSSSDEEADDQAMVQPRKTERILERYTEEETITILEKLNSYTLEQFEQLRWFSKAKALNIIQCRKIEKRFLGLDDLEGVPKLNNIKLFKICDALLYDESAEEKPMKQMPLSDIHPKISLQDCKNTKSVLSLDVRLDTVSWVKMSRDLTIEDWHQCSMFEQYSGRYDHAEYQAQLMRVIRDIPDADIYTYELIPTRYTNIHNIPFQVNNAILQAILTTLLNLRENNRQVEADSFHHKVYTIKSPVVQKMFKLSVGGERASCHNKIEDIINEESVQVDAANLETFRSYDNIGRELLGRCLLQALAVYKSSVFPGTVLFDKRRIADSKKRDRNIKRSPIDISKILKDEE